jgi:hypothetical protein
MESFQYVLGKIQPHATNMPEAPLRCAQLRTTQVVPGQGRGGFWGCLGKLSARHGGATTDGIETDTKFHAHLVGIYSKMQKGQRTFEIVLCHRQSKKRTAGTVRNIIISPTCIHVSTLQETYGVTIHDVEIRTIILHKIDVTPFF